MSENSAIEILRGKGWEVEDGLAFKETGFGYRVVFCGAGYPELVHDGDGWNQPVSEHITEVDLEALVEATNANREACGREPLFAAPQQQAAEAPENSEEAQGEGAHRPSDYARELAQLTSGWAAGWLAANRGVTHSFSTEEVRRILLALRFTENGGPWFHPRLHDLIVKAENCIEAATGEKA